MKMITRPWSLRQVFVAGGGLFLALSLATTLSWGSLEAAPATAQSPNDWPQLAYGPKRTGHNPQPISGPFSEKWRRDLGVPLADRVQPVIADGAVIIGDVAGTVHALNENNGQTVWTFSSGGSILYTAAIDRGKVFVGSHDGFIYALDVNSGTLIWQADVAKGAGGAPLVWNSQVFVSGKDGYFYALNKTNGALLWKFDTGATPPPSVRAPILSSPAIHPGKNLVYFAAENLKAYALNATTGKLVWVSQMYGESAYDSWPVVSETKDVVMFRTKSVYSFHASLVLDDGDLFCPGNTAGACSSCANLNPGNFNSPREAIEAGGPTEVQWDEQHFMNSNTKIDSIDEIFATYPQRLTFYVFDPGTGQPKWQRPAPILWTGGGGRVGIMPVVNDSTGDIYTLWRTKFSRRDADYFCRKWVDLGRLTVRNNLPTVDFLPCPGGGSNCPNANDFHFIGDETTVLSLAGDLLLMTGWYNTGALQLTDGTAHFISGTGYGLPEGGAGTGGDSAVPASVANKVVFVKHHQGFPAPQAEAAPYTVIAAYQGH